MFIRAIYTWEDDGGHTIRSYRHYAKEGPYPDGSESYDRTGRLKTRCSTGHCELYEYDEHGEISRVREQNSETYYCRVHENEYDPAGRLVRERIGGSESSFQYDARGNITEELRLPRHLHALHLPVPRDPGPSHRTLDQLLTGELNVAAIGDLSSGTSGSGPATIAGHNKRLQR